MMPAIRSLTSSQAFQKVYREGKGVADGSIAMRFRAREDPDLGMGIVAGKRFGSAVERNRAKRLLREFFRLNQERIREGFDLVVIARRGMRGLSYKETEGRLLELLRRAKLLKDK
jgi:ribonuclease P protein component